MRSGVRPRAYAYSLCVAALRVVARTAGARQHALSHWPQQGRSLPDREHVGLLQWGGRSAQGLQCRKKTILSIDTTRLQKNQQQPASSPRTIKASKAKDDAVAAANGERLRAAAQAGRLDELEAALSKLAHGDKALDLADWGGWTPLMHAASGDKPELVDQLLKKGARVDITDVSAGALRHRPLLACGFSSYDAS